MIKLTRPKVFVAENVKGLASLGSVKDLILRELGSVCGGDYLVPPPRVLSASNFGVPQKRERIIFIGISKSRLTAEARRLLSGGPIPAELDPYPSPTRRERAGLLD